VVAFEPVAAIAAVRRTGVASDQGSQGPSPDVRITYSVWISQR
jgi:hypothetical protein